MQQKPSLIGRHRTQGQEAGRVHPIRKAEEELVSLLGNVADAHIGRVRTEQGHLQQSRYGPGRVAEAIQQLVQNVPGVLHRTNGRNAAVQVHPLLGLGYIVLGDVGRHGEVGRAFGPNFCGLSLLLQHGVV